MPTIFDHPDWLAFERAICADPQDDNVRLIAADWLEDEYVDIWKVYKCPTCHGTGTNGAAERAEFIRLQIEHERIKKKTSEYFDPSHIGTSELQRLAARCLEIARRESQIHRSDWFDNPIIIMSATEQSWSGHGYGSCGVILRRGFIDEIHCTLAQFDQHAGEIAAKHPITKWVLTDREPIPWCHAWYSPLAHPSESAIGHDLYMAIEGCYFPTREAAMQALSDACYKVARQRARLADG